MSDSNRVQVAVGAETNIGEAADDPYTLINVSSVNLNAQKGTAEENTIRDNRNLRGLVQLNLVPQGGFGFDFIHNNLAPLMPGIMGSAISTPVSLSAVAGTVAGQVFTATAGTPFSVATVGQWLGIKIGTTKYICKVTAIGGAGANITIAGATLPSGAQTLASVKGAMIRNGTTMTSYTIEKVHTDQPTKGIFGFLGMIPNTMTLNAQAETIVTGDMQFMGMDALTPYDTTLSGTSFLPAPTGESFAGLKGNIGQFMVDGALVVPTQMAVKGVNLSINANVRRDIAININEMGWGQFGVTGQLSTYFKGGMSAVDAFYSHASSSVSYVMTDPAGNITVVTVLKLKFGNFNPQVGGKNQAVMGDLDFTGIEDPTLGATLQFDFITGL